MPGEADTQRRPDVFALIGFGLAARSVGTAVAVLSGLLTIALAVRLLGVSSYGALAFGLSTVAICSGLGRLGLDASITQRVAGLGTASDPARVAPVARGAFSLVAATGVVGIGVAAAVILSSSAGADEASTVALAAGLSVLLFATNVTFVASSLARGLGRMASMEAVTLVIAIGKLAVIALLTALGVADLLWVAVGYSLVGLAAIAAAAWLAYDLVGSVRVFVPAWGEARSVLVHAAPFAATGLAATVISRFDVLVLGLVATSADVGRYEPTLKLVEQVMLLAPLLFMAAFLPAATRLFTGGETEDFRELYVSVSKLVYVIGVLAIVAFAAFPEAILHGLYGASFEASATLVWLLLAGFVFNLALGLNGSALAGVGDRRALARAGVAGTLSMVLLAAALVPTLGTTGAALATSATYVVLNLVLSVELLRSTGVHPFRHDFVLTLVSSSVPVLAALAIREWAASVGLWQATGMSVMLWSAWVVLLFGFRAIRPGELRRLMPVPRKV